MFWSCCGLGRKCDRRDSEEPDETTRLLATSDALFPQVQEAPKPIDDAALLEYRQRIDRILEETAEKLVSVSNAPQPPLTHAHSNSSSSASTSTAKASRSTDDGKGGGDTSTPSGTGKDTLWRAEARSGAEAHGSLYLMKKVAKSSKAKGKQVAREVNNNDVAGLPNGYADQGSATSADGQKAASRVGVEEHDRDSTMASYRTAEELDEEDPKQSESGDDHSGTEEDGDTLSSQATSSPNQEKRIGQSHDRSRRLRAVQDIFQEDSLTQLKPQERLQKALALSDEDFSRQLTQQA